MRRLHRPLALPVREFRALFGRSMCLQPAQKQTLYRSPERVRRLRKRGGLGGLEEALFADIGREAFHLDNDLPDVICAVSL